MTIPTIHTLDPAFSLIEKLGGKSAVAEHLGLNKSTLTRWCRSEPDGTGGLIPQRYWAKLIEMGRRQKVRVTMSELTHIRA